MTDEDFVGRYRKILNTAHEYSGESVNVNVKSMERLLDLATKGVQSK